MGAVWSTRSPGVNGQKVWKVTPLPLFSFIVELLKLLFLFRYEIFKFSSCFLPRDLVLFMPSFLAWNLLSICLLCFRVINFSDECNESLFTCLISCCEKHRGNSVSPFPCFCPASSQDFPKQQEWLSHHSTSMVKSIKSGSLKVYLQFESSLPLQWDISYYLRDKEANAQFSLNRHTFILQLSNWDDLLGNAGKEI